MTHLTLLLPSGSSEICCNQCSQAIPASAPRLMEADSRTAVCRDCGRKQAPLLVALLDLARVAERVGHVGRYTLVPPLEALLDLARAAENYSYLLQEQGNAAT